MIRRFWASREGGLAKATVAILFGAFIAGSTITGAAVLLDVVAGSVR